ncbi:MAG: acetyl-CoA carboxylase biotin carboxylase subunit, partial [Betaproteobacteria bacterium]|nr:acetyl-CoA carboxylase biotin carboxylase subunit [Betaproteobacteria bacterium]
MFGKLLIANRGEIALRIQRACRELGIRTVCVYSEADRDAKYVKLADEAVCIGPASSLESYLNPAAIIAAMEITDAEAVHPGYGFLSENADFAEQVERSGFVFVGPKSETIRVMGDKIAAKKALAKSGLGMVPSCDIKDPSDSRALAKVAAQIGFPLILKAAAGGGGRGMRVIHNEESLQSTCSVLALEAERAFGDGTLYAEKLLAGARHIEVQVLADRSGNAVHLGTRDCSVQRRHQKIIEEAPAAGVSAKMLNKVGADSVAACAALGYRGAGTMEFLYDGRSFYFIEMNTRVQVEHPVTEMITGCDIVALQIRIAAGEKLPFRQKDIAFSGHAIECRINAEDPDTHAPCPGMISTYHPSGGPGVRVDAHVYAGSEITHHYDSLLGKLIVHGDSRKQAIARMRIALSEFMIGGIKT